KVDCVPACPKVCLNTLLKRVCRPVACTAGCVCKDGWVRRGSTAGKCILRNKCNRWIL
ncbi:hypothetical protein KR222_009256, partial [Zaprionus bogoriensis]